MIPSLIGIFASVVLFLSFIGWGTLVKRLLARSEVVDVGMQAAIGMAFLCCLGGVLNHFGLAGRWICFTIVTIGFVSFCIYLLLNRIATLHYVRMLAQECRKPVVLLLVLLLFAMSTVLLLGAAYKLFNAHDDHQGYAVLPMKMIQTGSLGIDPFNERRLVSGLGGQSFLHALFLSIGTFTSLNLLDLGVGRFVFLALLAGHLREIRAPLLWALITFVIVLLIPAAAMNISSTITGLALFYALFRNLSNVHSDGFVQHILSTSILFAGLCSLKHSYIPAAVLTTATFILIGNRSHTPLLDLKKLALVALTALLLLLPWMVESYKSNGTYLFAILGRGHHGSGYKTAADVTASFSELANLSYTFGKIFELVLSPEFVPSLLLTVWILYDVRKTRGKWRENKELMILFSTWLIAIGFACLTGNPRRYTYPYTCAALFLGFHEKLKMEWKIHPRTVGIPSVLMLVVVAVFYVSGGIHQLRVDLNWFWAHRHKVLNNLSGSERARAVQASVPPGKRILVVLSRPAMLDFNRNQIFVVDHAASTSPPPGLPITGTANEIADYLLGQDIRYVMYSYGDEASYARKLYEYRLLAGGSFRANRTRRLAENNIRFRERIVEMSQKFRLLADDGFQYMIDLGTVPEIQR